jgi:LPXTG-motif cell wall-anchored protein
VVHEENKPLMNVNWMTVVAILVIIVAAGYLVMKRRQKS